MNWQVPRAIVLPPTPPAAWTALLHGVGIDYFGDSARWSSSLPPNCSGRTLRNAAPGTGHDARKNSQKPQFPHSVAASPLPRGAYGPQGSTCPPANRRACVPYAPPPRSSPAISRPVAPRRQLHRTEWRVLAIVISSFIPVRAEQHALAVPTFLIEADEAVERGTSGGPVVTNDGSVVSSRPT